MNLRVILLWTLLISCAQIKAQEIIAKFNSQPVITLSTKAIRIKLDYSVCHAKNKELKLIINICDDSGNVVLDDLEEFTPTDNELSYTLDKSYFLEELKENKHATLYLSAVICWSSYEGAGHNWAFTDKIPFSLNVNSFNASTSSSSNTNSKYKALSDPNLVDNSEEISRCEKVIAELENQKLHCSYCNGTHKIPTICTMCRGTGTIKMGYYTPQFFKCNYCGGTGRTSKPCIECQQTDVSISISRSMLKTYKETHGMTKENAALYHEHNSKMVQMDRDHQNAINAIAEPYLNSIRKSNSSHSSTSTSSKTCSYCGGTGVSKIGILGSGGTGVAYTNATGEDCPYCDEYDYKFHHHERCSCRLK